MNKLTPLDKTKLGKSLMHGPSTFDRYRFINIKAFLFLYVATHTIYILQCCAR
jgi:hypothetical protein